MKLPKLLLKNLKRQADVVMQRPPAKRIGESYLTRWHIVPKNRLFNVYLHHVQADDPDDKLHDHPWLFNCSIVLRGRIEETLPRGRRVLGCGSMTARLSRAPHRLALQSDDSLTLFITGPKIRRWGFYTERGWVDSSDYLQADGNGRHIRQKFSGG